MGLCRTIIAAALPLLMASEAVAQASADDKGPKATGRSRQVAAPGASGPAAAGAPLIRIPALADEQRFAEARGNVFGSVSIADDLALQVGLLKVNRSRRGERPLSQSHPMRDVGGSHWGGSHWGGSQGRIAAAGLRFSF